MLNYVKYTSFMQWLMSDICVAFVLALHIYSKMFENTRFLLTFGEKSHLLQSKNEQTLLYIGVKPCAKGSIYVALEWGYLYLTFFNISNNLFDFLTSNNLGVESEAGFGM